MNQDELLKKIQELENKIFKIESHARWKKKKFYILFAILISVTMIIASSITKPHTFSDGDILSAGKLNANFDTLYSKVNELDTVVNNYSNRVAKGWVKFDGATCAPGCTIISSYNIASVTRNGTGDYTIIFTTALSDAKYVTAISTTGVFNGSVISLEGGSDNAPQPNTASLFRIAIRGNDGNPYDAKYIHATVHGN